MSSAVTPITGAHKGAESMTNARSSQRFQRGTLRRILRGGGFGVAAGTSPRIRGSGLCSIRRDAGKLPPLVGELFREARLLVIILCVGFGAVPVRGDGCDMPPSLPFVLASGL